MIDDLAHARQVARAFLTGASGPTPYDLPAVQVVLFDANHARTAAERLRGIVLARIWAARTMHTATWIKSGASDVIAEIVAERIGISTSQLHRTPLRDVHRMLAASDRGGAA